MATLAAIRPPARHLCAFAAALLAVAALAACGGQTVVVHHGGAASPVHARTSATRGAGGARAGSQGPVALRYRELYRLAAPVQDPASAALGDGRFALLGGLTAADTSTADVVVGDVHGAAVKTSLPNAQHDAQAAALGGRVYVFGGGQYTEYDHILDYDAATNAVAGAGSLPTASSDSTVTGDGSTAYVVGGYDGARWLDTVLAFQPGSPPRVLAHLPVGLRYAAAAFAGGSILVAGGSTPSGISDTVYRVDPRTGSVTTLVRLPAGVTHAAAGVIGETMYLVGGRGENVSDRTAQVLAIDPAHPGVRRVATLPEPLSDAAVVSLGDGLIVAGGAAASGTQSVVGELVPAAG